MTPQGAPQKKSTAVVLLIVLGAGGLAMVCCIGMLAAIALPNFLKFNVRAKQAEAKSNLKAIYTAERSYFGEKDAFSNEFATIGFDPGRGTRYLYVLSPSGTVLEADSKTAPTPPVAAYLAAIPPGLRAEAGVHGTCPADCYVTAIAVGNLDTDSTFDVWSVSTQERTFGGEKVPAGQPFMHVNDVDN